MFYNLSVLLNFRYASVAPYVSIKTLGIFSQLSANTLLISEIYPTITVAIPAKQHSYKNI